VAWLLTLAALLAWQGWMTLGLFACREEPRRLLDERVVSSGRHPLHYYHGLLGARMLLRRGGPSCYDPAFHAGYPRTPVFDGGSRPAELVLAATGGAAHPAPYKIFLAGLTVLVPVLLWLTGRALGLPRAGALLTAVLGLLVWWGRPCREAFEAGEVDLLLASLLVVVQSGLLLRYHRHSCPLGLLGVLATGFLGWLAHPLLMALLLPLFLIYYLSVGARHGLVWHTALVCGLVAAVGCNAFWLLDWIHFSWIRQPFQAEAADLLTHRTFRTVWEAPLWGGPVDRALACVLLVLALTGALLTNRCGQRAAARLFGLTAALFFVLAGYGITCEPVGRLGTTRLIVPGLLFTTPLAAYALSAVLRRLGKKAVPLVLLGLAALAAPAWLAPASEQQAVWAARIVAPEPLHLGLEADQIEVAARLARHTTPAARILWEDRRVGRLEPHWTPLLPLLTGRTFVGGLDPDAGIEHLACGLTDQIMEGRALSDWSDIELDEYCTRYNIGWVVCWTPGSAQRFAAWKKAAQTTDLPGGGMLFAIDRQVSYALVGKARWLQADPQGIVLGDVVPVQGRVVISMHYQAGLRASPARVRVEPELDPHDPIPLVRLVVDDPVARVTLTWEKR
jgi:hypothetical protein